MIAATTADVAGVVRVCPQPNQEGTPWSTSTGRAFQSPPDRLYRTIADIGNLTKFVPPLTSVRRKDPDHVDVDASYEGHEQHGEAWFRTDDSARRIEWGSEGHPYRGWTQVDPDGQQSKLTVHLTTSYEGNIQDDVRSTFESIRKMF